MHSTCQIWSNTWIISLNLLYYIIKLWLISTQIYLIFPTKLLGWSGKSPSPICYILPSHLSYWVLRHIDSSYVNSSQNILLFFLESLFHSCHTVIFSWSLPHHHYHILTSLLKKSRLFILRKKLTLYSTPIFHSSDEVEECLIHSPFFH